MPSTVPAPPASPSLTRSLSLPDVAALGVNTVVGSGIFLLPGLVAAKVGPAALLATLVAGLAAFLIALCFAEVGSRFTATGGPYLYARAALGDFVGFEVGWITCWTGLAAWAALANAFTTALGHLVPAVAGGWPQRLTLAALIAALGLVNLLGAKPGAWVSNVATVAKLGVLVAFVLLGLPHLEPRYFHPFAPAGMGSMGGAVLLMLYAYVGFENLVVPAGEMRDPRRAVPRALVLVMGTVTALYLGVQAVVTGTLAHAAGVANAVAESAAGFLGGAGGALVGGGIVVSILGVNAASAVIAPRRFYAMAEHGEMPSLLGRVHPRLHTPWVAIAFTYLVTLGLALSGSFQELAVLTVVGRLLQYAPTCLAALVLRRRDAPGTRPAFRLPLGPTLPVAAMGLCGWLLLAAEPRQLVAGLAAVVTGVPVYAWLRWRRRARAPALSGTGRPAPRRRPLPRPDR